LSPVDIFIIVHSWILAFSEALFGCVGFTSFHYLYRDAATAPIAKEQDVAEANSKVRACLSSVVARGW
jgi:hypothetical protein